MTGHVPYPYSDGNLLEHRNDYFYTAFHGPAFLAAWEHSRALAVQDLEAKLSSGENVEAAPRSPAERMFASLHDAAQGASATVAVLIRRFEVTKRVFGNYDEQLRRRDPEDFRSLINYVAFAELLEAVHRRSHCLPALNALLKCMDILVAHRDDVPSVYVRRVAVLIEREREHVLTLAAKVGAASR